MTELHLQHQYNPERVYNTGESGSAVRESQSSKALINACERSTWKVISGRQEWITVIECIDAAGRAIPSLTISKARYTNTTYIRTDRPADYRFSTSNSGWTSGSHVFEWLTTVFELSTRPTNPTDHRLLVLDSHGSHITANMIVICMQHAKGLSILPPHTSHMLQLRDISVFSLPKRALAAETDATPRLDSGRLQKVEWTRMYIWARQRALTTANIVSGWKATGLEPLSLIAVLEKLETSHTPRPLPPQT
jgi:hypothetical protein